MRLFSTFIFIFLTGVLPVRADADRLLNSLKPAGYVSDFAGVMSPDDRAVTERLLNELEQKCGAQVAVVTLRSLDGGQIDDFAVRLFERWKIGQKGKDNGFLLIAAVEDRKVRIETGYGFEGVFPDAAAGRLIDQVLRPAFRAGDYSGGLRKGAETLAAVAAKASGVELTGISDLDNEGRPGRTLPDFIGLFLLVIFIIGPMFPMFFLPPGGPQRRSGGYWVSGGGYRGGSFGGSGFGGFGGGRSGGGGASGGW